MLRDESTANSEPNPHDLMARYPKLRKLTGVVLIFVGFAAMRDVMAENAGAMLLAVAMATCFVAAGVLVLTRYWETGKWVFYLGFGLYWIARGLSEEKNHVVHLIGGGLLVALTLPLVVGAGLAWLRAERLKRRAGV